MTRDEMFKLAATIAAPIIAKKIDGRNTNLADGVVHEIYMYLCKEYSKISTISSPIDAKNNSPRI